MKKIYFFITLCLFTTLLNSQTISEFSSGYTSLEGIAINTNNEVYVSEHDSGNIYKLDPDGNETLVGTAGGFANDMVFDTNNDLYITEPFTNKISVINNTTGIMSEYISTFSIGNSPYGIDFANGSIYFCSESNSKVVKINSDLTTTDYATDFFTPEGIAFDSNGNLFVADRNDRKLFKITPTGAKTTIASSIPNIRGVAVSVKNEVFFTMYNSFPAENKILKYDPVSETVSDYITTTLDQPRSLEIDDLGNMYVTNLGNGTVVKITDPSLLPDPNIVYIPDFNFKSELLNNVLINTNMDQEIQKSEANTYQGFMNIDDKNIADLTGIEEFTEITGLSCKENQLTVLDFSSNTKLTLLSCSNNNLNSLDVSKNNQLTHIYCTDNQLTQLNTSQNTLLTTLWCQRNKIENLDTSNNTLLIQLLCANNMLSDLDVSKNTELKYLLLGQNFLTDIELSSNINLINLNFFNNDIATIDLSKNVELTFLNCQTNGMTSLDITKNTKLTDISIGSNIDLEEIDLTANTLLEKIEFQSVDITNLDLSKNVNLKEILGSSTKLQSIDLRNNNNQNITDFSILNAFNLSCIFVDDSTYSQTNWTNPNPDLTMFVETEEACNTTLSTTLFEQDNFKIYPNPVTSVLTINSPFKEAFIYDLQGKQVLLGKTQQINLEKLAKGIYVIKIFGDSNSLTVSKFIKR